MELLTKRLRIHEFDPGMFSSAHEYGTDPEVFRFQHWGPNSEQDTRNFLQFAIDQSKKEPRLIYEMAVSLRDGKHIGGARVGISSVANRNADIGYTLHRSQWGNGVGTELARAMVTFGFQKLGMHRIFATADPQNIASIRVLEKCGMIREGILRENLLVRGKWRDSVLFSILESDFQKMEYK